jgi:hypothetical protein
MTGGMVSLGPPLGGVVVFAHEGENIIVPIIMATGTAGIKISNSLFFISIL